MAPPFYPATDIVVSIFRHGVLADLTLLQFQVKKHAVRYPVTGVFELMETQRISDVLPMINVLIDFWMRLWLRHRCT